MDLKLHRPFIDREKDGNSACSLKRVITLSLHNSLEFSQTFSTSDRRSSQHSKVNHSLTNPSSLSILQTVSTANRPTNSSVLVLWGCGPTSEIYIYPWHLFDQPIAVKEHLNTCIFTNEVRISFISHWFMFDLYDKTKVGRFDTSD